MTDVPASMTQHSDRYFGYMIAKPDDTHDIVVHPRPADAEVIEEFDTLTSAITRLQPLLIALAACEADFESLVSWPADEEERLRNSGGFNIPISVVNDLMVESVRRINAYLASASSLIGQATIHVSAHFGSDSEFGTAWHSVRRGLHAGSLGYRVSHELRNYAQHYALPLGQVHITGRRDSGGEMIMNCGASLNRDALLNSGYDWKKRIEDLAQLPAEFDLLSLAEDYQRCLRTLVVEIVRVNTSQLKDSVEYLKAIRRVLNAPSDARIWLFHGKGGAGSPPTSGTIVPEEQLDWVLRTLAAAAKDVI